ncbi:MAG: PilZ domain-containing protein [Leptospiraceae bacterium]
MAEKRKEKRINSVLPITVRTPRSTVQCVSMNVSRSGVGFLSEKIIPPGSVTLQIAQSSVKGRILYRKEHGPGSVMSTSNVYQYGVRLEVSVPAAELEKWIFTSRMPSKGRA